MAQDWIEGEKEHRKLLKGKIYYYQKVSYEWWSANLGFLEHERKANQSRPEADFWTTSSNYNDVILQASKNSALCYTHVDAWVEKSFPTGTERACSRATAGCVHTLKSEAQTRKAVLWTKITFANNFTFIFHSLYLVDDSVFWYKRRSGGLSPCEEIHNSRSWLPRDSFSLVKKVGIPQNHQPLLLFRQNTKA